MAIRLTELSPVHRSALTRLDDSQTHEDSVGCRFEDLLADDQVACAYLVAHGLAEAWLGWRGTLWFRLTERGRAVRDKGWVA